MAAFKLDRFLGLLPRMSPSLLPPPHATIAKNCDFAYGELRSTNGDFNFAALANFPASIYTDTGLLFYSWPYDVDAVRSPLANDTFDRLYYTTPTDFRVALRAGMATNGGVPGASYRVGVPAPAVAPTMTVPNTPPLSAATLVATFHYEYSGVKYQETVVGLTTVTALEKWSFSVPAKLTTTPDGAFPALHLVAKEPATNNVIFDIYTANSALAANDDWILTLGSTSATAFTIALASLVTDADKETRSYLYTYVNTYGEEGPPSVAAQITALSTLTVTVSAVKDVQTVDYAPIKEIRIYRTPTGSEVADYFYVGTIPVLSGSGTFTFVDNVKAAGLNEPLSSGEFYPPDVALVGLMALPNGILCAWKGNQLHFSEAYKPWAWPPSYIKRFRHAIVGGIVSGGGALITTQGMPFLISGVSPDSMTESRIKTEQAGVSKWSMADVGGVLLYASNDGIVAVEGATASMAYSEQFFTRDVWRALYKNGLSTMRFSVWDGRLIVYSEFGFFTPFMLRLDEAKGAMTDLPNFAASCTFVSPVSDQCYRVAGNQIYQFAGGAPATATWMSHEMVARQPINFGAAQALVEGSWTIDFYALNKVNGVDAISLVHSKAVTTGQTDFRLPSGFLSDRWQIKITGTGRFRELRIGPTARSLKEL